MKDKTKTKTKDGINLVLVVIALVLFCISIGLLYLAVKDSKWGAKIHDWMKQNFELDKLKEQFKTATAGDKDGNE